MRAAELCMVRLYEIAAREDIDAGTLQAISRSLNDSLRALHRLIVRPTNAALLTPAAGRPYGTLHPNTLPAPAGEPLPPRYRPIGTSPAPMQCAK